MRCFSTFLLFSTDIAHTTREKGSLPIPHIRGGEDKGHPKSGAWIRFSSVSPLLHSPYYDYYLQINK